MVYRNDYLHDKYASNKPKQRNKNKVHRVKVSTKKKQKAQSKTKKVVGVSMVVVFVVFLLFGNSISDTYTIIFSSASDDMKQAAKDAGLSQHGQAIFLRQDPEFVSADTLSAVCRIENENIHFGCFLPVTGKIYVLQIDDDDYDEVELSTIAHETMHAVWSDMPINEQLKLGSVLNEFYESKSSYVLSNSASAYKDKDDDQFKDELHSIVGSQVNLPRSNTELIKHYNKYFSNRQKSILADEQFNNKLDSTLKWLEDENGWIDKEGKDIAAFKSQYLDKIESYMQSNLYYGDYSRYNQNVDAYNANLKIYKNKVNIYNSRIDSYNTKRQNYLSTYQSLFPSKNATVPKSK